MNQEPYYPAGMSDAEAALLQQAHGYRGQAVFAEDAPVESATSAEPASVGQIVWARVRSLLRQAVVGLPAEKKPAKKGAKKSASSRVKKVRPSRRFVGGWAFFVAILVLMMMPAFSFVSPLIAIVIALRALIVGRLRGVKLAGMIFIVFLSVMLLFYAV